MRGDLPASGRRWSRLVAIASGSVLELPSEEGSQMLKKFGVSSRNEQKDSWDFCSRTSEYKTNVFCHVRQNLLRYCRNVNILLRPL